VRLLAKRHFRFWEMALDHRYNRRVDLFSSLMGKVMVGALLDQVRRLPIHGRDTPFLGPKRKLGVLLAIGTQGDT